ncbi:MAG: ATP-binding protein, partial [Myxococcales bacterium]|nr:ATP-binding protein [Myxococcales bacterium]
RKGRVVLANDSFARWAGQSPEKLIGREASRFPWQLPEPTGAGNRLPWIRAMEERVPQARFLLQLSDRDSRLLTLVANSSPVLGHDGEYRGVLTSFEDVTELEQHKVELSSAKQAADEANQAKSEFLARMSHEIRTPMNAILGYTEVLRRGFAESEEQRAEHLLTIQNSGEHLLALINDILDLSKIEAGRMVLELARCSPHEIVSQVVAVLRIKAQEKGLTLDYEPAGKLPETVLTDAVRLRQAVINLVGNAIKFTETGGVRVIARLIHEPRTLLAIDVVDTGIGMSEDALEKVFEPFAQADTTITRRFGGTGLGLSICKQIAEQMGGGVAVRSRPGIGTTFTLTMDPGPLAGVPLVEFDAAAQVLPSQTSTQQQHLCFAASRILVVDDGEENRRLVTLFLRRVGAEVTSAQNGQIAVDIVAERDFDCILMDMQMPVMDGFTATRQLRERGCTIPIIALTANVMKDDERKCRAAGCSGFLAKPISMDRLMESLSRVLTPSDSSAAPPLTAVTTANPDSHLPLSDDEDTAYQCLHDAVMDLADEALAATPVFSSLPTEDPEFREIVAGFVIRLQERVSEMQQAAAQEDLTELGDLAHWLKGAGGSCGFEMLTSPAAALQSSAESGDRERATKHLKAIQQLTRRIQLGACEPAPQSS